ncbi:Rdx family protein [Myxococcota bacterium]|nr:Rdx family protein [Myxococcota bacterium]
MAAAIREERGLEAELVEGGGGVFDVFVDGTRIYSKQQTGRFPDAAEILEQL